MAKGSMHDEGGVNGEGGVLRKRGMCVAGGHVW